MIWANQEDKGNPYAIVDALRERVPEAAKNASTLFQFNGWHVYWGHGTRGPIVPDEDTVASILMYLIDGIAVDISNGVERGFRGTARMSIDWSIDSADINVNLLDWDK